MATTVLHTSPSVAAPQIAAGAPSLRNSTFVRLLRFALANVRRRPERFLLAVFGIALAILSVTVVRTISSSFAPERRPYSGKLSTLKYTSPFATYACPSAINC